MLQSSLFENSIDNNTPTGSNSLPMINNNNLPPSTSNPSQSTGPYSAIQNLPPLPMNERKCLVWSLCEPLSVSLTLLL
jgi:hypothetical protein